MQIEFTKQQFKNLLKLIYLGEWMTNAHRTDDRIKKYEDMLNYIFSYAKKFGFEKYVDDEDVNNGKFYPTRFFEEKTDVDQLHEEYDDKTFWDELIHRLGKRDFFRKYSKNEIKKMSEEEWFEKFYRCINKWGDEVDKYEIERLSIKK